MQFLPLLLVEQGLRRGQAREAAFAEAQHEDMVGVEMPGLVGGQYADAARLRRRSRQTSLGGESGEAAQERLAVERPAPATAPPLLALQPLIHFPPQLFQRRFIAGVFPGRSDHAQVRGEAVQPGRVFHQRRCRRSVVPRLEKATNELAALFRQLVGAPPPRFLGLFVLQPRLLLFRPAPHRLQNGVAAARLGQQSQQRLGRCGRSGPSASGQRGRK